MVNEKAHIANLTDLIKDMLDVRMNHNGWKRCNHGPIGREWHSL